MRVLHIAGHNDSMIFLSHYYNAGYVPVGWYIGMIDFSILVSQRRLNVGHLPKKWAFGAMRILYLAGHDDSKIL